MRARTRAPAGALAVEVDGEAEVGELDGPAGADEDVVRLDVAVHPPAVCGCIYIYIYIYIYVCIVFYYT